MSLLQPPTPGGTPDQQSRDKPGPNEMLGRESLEAAMERVMLQKAMSVIKGMEW